VHRRRWRDHNPNRITTGGSGCSRPDGLTLPISQPPEETPQECMAGRDAVRVCQNREFKPTTGISP